MEEAKRITLDENAKGYTSIKDLKEALEEE